MKFEIGKIPPEILEKIVMAPIHGSRIQRSDIVLRPKTGEDCSAVDFGGELCVLSTDPITGAAKDMGYLAVQINCNDIFSAGAEAVGILLTILLPPESDEEMLREIMDGAIRAAGELNIEILGGHTEVTEAVCKPLVSATVIGKSRNRNIVCTGGGKVGQDVVMTKYAGLEGTAIIAKEYEQQLLSLGISPQVIADGKRLSAFLSVRVESEVAFVHGATAMHDATEGGILGAVWELADCSDLGITLWQDKVPVLPETREICRGVEIDPLRLISSGSMVIATADGSGLVEKLGKRGIPATVIGRLTAGDKCLVVGNETLPLTQPQSDALYQVKLLENKVL